ncbi:MAG: hypothetical protein LBG84_01945 [Treponema sp.]|nr:hypothetical protein [Treponema sp.]
MTYKYYEYDEMAEILTSLGFTIQDVYGYYDKRAVKDGDEMIFVCGKGR